MSRFDIIVIGGGPAGMLSAGAAASKGAKVLLLERNEKVGRKLFITGKGRCNLTNDSTVQEVLDNIPTGKKFLYSALNGFTPSDVMAFFESLGVALKTERGGRVFPQSDKSADIVDALRRYIIKTGVKLKCEYVSEVTPGSEGTFSVVTSKGGYRARAVIIATGGMSYPATGSTGDGYEMAKKLGHTVTNLRGSLVPLEAEPDLCLAMQGLALKNVSVSVFDGGKKPVFVDFGELLFTHFGLSGPLALSASAHMRDFEKKKYYVLIDLKPALCEKKLDLRILRDFEKYKSRDFSNALGDLLSRSMIPAVIEKSGIAPGKKVHSVTREERHSLVKLLKAFRIDIDGPRPVDEAIITSGGVALKEINPKTMESKIISGLYFAGEIIDADAYTGGYNLQIAWSTAYAAGGAAAKEKTALENKSIALDGPAGAGKSTLARRVAEHFGIIYVDTGALYRCIGLFVLRSGLSSRDEHGVAALLPKINLEMKYDGEGIQRMFLNGEDVTDEIRLHEASKYASDVSAMPPVREFLLDMQRKMAVKYNTIMDGRDIGTIVLPDAGLKIFITAQPEIRAHRRYLELKEKDPGITLEKVSADMVSRDKYDSERAIAPLKAADDAVLIDTTNLDLEESFKAICNLISGRLEL